MMRSILVTGATSLIAEHCLRLWAAEGDCRFLLAARNGDKLARIAADLRVRAPDCVIDTRVIDLCDPVAVAALFAEADPDIVLIAQGMLPEQDAAQADLALLRDAFTATALSPLLCAEAAAQRLALRGRGTLAIIGSVAGDRGRRSNYLYGAAKAALATAAEGLDHRFAASAVRVLLIKPGPTATPMTAHLSDSPLHLADPAAVARDIVRAISRARHVLYTPWHWRAVMAVIRLLPRALFARLPL